MAPQSHRVPARTQRAIAGAALLSRVAKGGLLVSIALAAIALKTQRLRYIHAYFAASGFLMTIGLGALFFVLLHHLLKARWSVIASRQMQWVATLLPWCVLLFLPNLLWARENFPWMAAGATTNLPETDKIGYLRAPWFFARAAAYWAIWTWLSWWYTGPKSQLEGSPESERHIERCRRFSGPALLLFAITTTFASFDWFMSLQPNWHSAIFGVYIFAGAVPSALAMLALFTVLLERLGVVRATYNVATRHDIAKLLFGFIMFWAYIAFSQYLLIWYAGISLETSFYRLRFNNDWLPTTLWLFALQFVVPFAALLSASAKRSSLVLFAVSLVVVLAHALDIFWLVMPALESGHPRLCFADFAAATLPVSALLLLLAKGIQSESHMPQQTHRTPNLEPLQSL